MAVGGAVGLRPVRGVQDLNSEALPDEGFADGVHDEVLFLPVSDSKTHAPAGNRPQW
ncbi:hypothetical protein D3C71_2250990 [compost metagenome]